MIIFNDRPDSPQTTGFLFEMEFSVFTFKKTSFQTTIINEDGQRGWESSVPCLPRLQVKL